MPNQMISIRPRIVGGGKQRVNKPIIRNPKKGETWNSTQVSKKHSVANNGRTQEVTGIGDNEKKDPETRKKELKNK